MGEYVAVRVPCHKLNHNMPVIFLYDNLSVNLNVTETFAEPFWLVRYAKKYIMDFSYSISL
jgi:hypothetical protein